MEISTEEYFELMQLAYADELTGLGNRNAMKKRWSKDEGEITDVLLVDLNDFKRVNDVYGHAAGDEVLKRFAIYMQTAFRGCAIAYRLGGDEFALFVMADVYNIIESLELWEGPHRVTASVGSAATESGFCSEDLRVNLKNADVAMYANKESRKGVNRDRRNGSR